MKDRQYCVYIMTNAHNTVLYTGVTNSLQRRVLEHKSGAGSKFTGKYNIDKLIYYEQTNNIASAIDREKQLKKWRREKKIRLIEKSNPLWIDLSDEIW